MAETSQTQNNTRQSMVHNINGTTYVCTGRDCKGCGMSYDILKELKLYFDDHYETFNCYPVEFEFNKTVFNYDECVKLLNSVGYLWRGDA